MTLGLRQLLLLAATIVFVVSIFINGGTWLDWVSIGFSCLAAAFLVGEMGWDRPLTGGTTHRSQP